MNPAPFDETRNGDVEPSTPRRILSPRLLFRMIQVRLRLIVLLVVAFLVVGQWDALRNRWEGLVRWATGRAGVSQAVSSDTEFFCPMDPGVLSDWPGKCSICNMALVRRKRGEVVPLPDGVVARMQFSPYRLQLAGIQTSAVGYRPLELQVESPGTVHSVARPKEGPSQATIYAEIFDRDLAAVAVDDSVEVSSTSGLGNGPWTGKVREIRNEAGPGSHRAVIAVADPDPEVAEGMPVLVRFQRSIEKLNPFRSQPADPPPLRKGERRTFYACPEHPETLREASGRCPRDQLVLEPVPLAANQRAGWWCPMHPEVTSEQTGSECSACGGMKLVPRVITYRPKGQVLAIPESAVVDTGMRRVVYVERMPGMFDGVEVVLGPRCGDEYPVVRGLEPGQRVATSGAFLIDAETRLNPSLAAAYFGSGPRSSSSSQSAPPVSRPDAAPAEPSLSDKALAAKQKICPVTGKKLGSMGKPVRLVVEGKDVMICCEGCSDALQDNPKKYLSKLP